MKELFVPYNESMELKELGFREDCFGNWWFRKDIHKQGEEELKIIESSYFELPEYFILAPTYSQAFKFFREKYNLFYDILEYTGNVWKFTIYSHNSEEYFQGAEYKTYEEAELECLKKLIEIVKNK
jgi:hypothetical protein